MNNVQRPRGAKKGGCCKRKPEPNARSFKQYSDINRDVNVIYISEDFRILRAKGKTNGQTRERAERCVNYRCA